MKDYFKFMGKVFLALLITVVSTGVAVLTAMAVTDNVALILLISLLIMFILLVNVVYFTEKRMSRPKYTLGKLLKDIPEDKTRDAWEDTEDIQKHECSGCGCGKHVA